MQFLGFYKRAGHRVIINANGDLIVRPAHFELSMLQHCMHGGAPADHATVSYQDALVAIISAQLADTRRHDDGLHGLLGLLKQLPQVRHCVLDHALLVTPWLLMLFLSRPWLPEFTGDSVVRSGCIAISEKGPTPVGQYARPRRASATAPQHVAMHAVHAANTVALAGGGSLAGGGARPMWQL